MIHGTTINLYSVGHCRLALCLALALVSSCFAVDSSPWTDGDVTYLLSLVDDVQANTYATEQILVEISGDVSAIKFLLDRIDDKTVDINDNLVAISNLLRKLTFDNVSQLRVTDTGVLHRVSSIDSKMDRIELAINNLTNYMCYSQEYTCTFNSNMMHLVTSYFGGAWPFMNGENLGSSMYDQLENMSDLIQAGDYEYLNRYYGLWKAFPTLLYSIVDYRHIPPGMFSRFRSAFNMLSLGSLVVHTNSLQQVSEPIYYQYGTRELTDTTIGISNFLASANQTGITDLDGSLSSHTVYDSTGSASHSTTSLFGRVSGQLGKTFGIYGEPAETNDVKKIDSPQLSSQQSTIIADNIQYSINDGCQQVNSTVSGIVDSIFDGRNTSGSFVIQGFTINHYNVGMEDVTINPSEYNLHHAGLRWFFNAVRALCLVGFVISSLWRIISVESKLNAPDPF